MLIVTLSPHIGTEIVILISNLSFPSLHHTRHLLGGWEAGKNGSVGSAALALPFLAKQIYQSKRYMSIFTI